MLMAGENFQIIEADNYIDWGTLQEYRDYTRAFYTLFCDVDGVLLYNGSKFGKKGWCTEPIIENLEAISKIQKLGHLYLIITSSRPESEIEYISKRLAEYEVHPDKYVMGLPHAKRILINDYSQTNQYPTAISINIERDSKTLSNLIDALRS